LIISKSKPRLLIPITIQFSVRYLLRTGLLKKVIEYAQPVVLLGWSDNDLKQELEVLGAEVHDFPRPSTNKNYETIRQQINFLHQKQVNSSSQKIDSRRADLERTFRVKFRRNIRKFWYQTKFIIPGATQVIRNREIECLWNDTNFRTVVEVVRTLKIDAVFCLTPYISNEEFVLRAAKYLQIPMCTSILSFDNLTTRGWIPIIFDHYFLWNKYNEQELKRIYPEANDRSITIVGAPQFDFYYDKNYIWDEKTWRKRISIPLDRQVILFGGGPPLITPMEPYWVSQIDDAIERDLVPNNPLILVRPHPLDSIERWVQALKRTKNVYYDIPWNIGKNPGFINIRNFDIEKLASTLYYSDVHMNTSSTMTVDGAIFDRPQIGLAYDDRPGSKYDRASKELYLREHYLPITNSGGLDIAYSYVEMINAIKSAMLTPQKLKLGREKMVLEICSFNDGKATERVNNSLYSFMQSI